MNETLSMYLDDDILGRIRLIPNGRARRVIVRYRDNEYQVTHPSVMKGEEVEKVIEQMKPRLLKLKERVAIKYQFSEETKFSTLTFGVEIKRHRLNNIYTSLSNGLLAINFPQTVDLKTQDIQEYIQRTIEAVCRAEAKKVLPSLTKELAAIHGFDVEEIKINKSRGRWGSCSYKKNINLSYFCMMLPKHLIDFVILHELCHTKEMNHGERFWALLDKVSGGKSVQLTKELKQFRLAW